MGCSQAHGVPQASHAKGSAVSRRKDLSVEDEDPSRTIGFSDKYTVGEKLSSGKFGDVWVARRCCSAEHDDSSGREKEYAVKKMDLKKVGKHSAEEAVWRAATEASSHCVVALHEVFHSGMVCHLVMELCDMRLLDALTQAPEINELTLGRAFKQMLRALEGIHHASIIHRNIRPESFMANHTSEGALNVKLGDFSLATFHVKGLHVYDCCGYMPYMSPEMLQEGVSYDEKTDVWSLGVLMYVLLYGQFPYYTPEKPGPHPDVLRKTIKEGKIQPTFRPWKNQVEGAPSGRMTAMVHQCLNRCPERRAAAAEVLKDPIWKYLSKQGAGDHTICLRPMLMSAIKHGAFDLDGDEEGYCTESRGSGGATYHSHGSAEVGRSRHSHRKYSKASSTGSPSPSQTERLSECSTAAPTHMPNPFSKQEEQGASFSISSPFSLRMSSSAESSQKTEAAHVPRMIEVAL